MCKYTIRRRAAGERKNCVFDPKIKKIWCFLAEKYVVFEAEKLVFFFVSNPPWGWGGVRGSYDI